MSSGEFRGPTPQEMGIDPLQREAGQKTNQEIISGATSLNDLISTIRTNDISIEGSTQIYDARTLVDVIERIRRGELDITSATSRDGFREKITELLEGGETLPEDERLIQDATTFGDLVDKIWKHKISITGSVQEYDPATLAIIAQKIRSREVGIDTAPTRKGFRKKLEELLESDTDIEFLKAHQADLERQISSLQEWEARVAEAINKNTNTN